jgi:AcrR family transcriptional regulator
MTEPHDNHEVARDRILHVAAGLFVEHGFKATSVRKICELAGVNVSMVNYYFHSKEELHLAVFDYARQQATTGPSLATGAGATPEQQLQAAITEFMFNLLSSGPASLFTRLLARELVEPTRSITSIVEQDIKPQHQQFGALVRAIAGDTLSDIAVQQCVFSIIGQAVFYPRSRPVHDLAVPGVRYDEAGIRAIADHIYRFSLAALLALKPAS